jgi:hypothetical protein
LKPKVFIGSSREGVAIANAIHSNLTREAECTVWANGVFQLSANVLVDLIRVLRESDFGVFVFAPDDLIVMREQTNLAVRDNVIFELGLFIGRLGAERCFFLVPEDSSDLRLPSDLAGINPGVYESNRRDGNLMAALNPACMQIGVQMSRLKAFQDAVAVTPAQRDQIEDMPRAITRSTTKKKPSQIEDELGKITAEAYKSQILVKGNTKPHKELFKQLGGRWITSLQGWTISPTKMPELKKHIKSIDQLDDF